MLPRLVLLVIGCLGCLSSPARAGQPADKSWANNPAAFAAASPGRHWVVGECAFPTTTQAEAAAGARDAAAEQLLPLVQAQLRLRRSSLAAAPGPHLKAKLADLLADARFIADRDIRRVDRPYGTLWDVRLLVDASAGNLNRLTDRLVVGHQAAMWRRGVSLGSVAVIAIALLAAYALANALTRGYFAWQLRAAFALLFAVGAAVVLLFV